MDGYTDSEHKDGVSGCAVEEITEEEDDYNARSLANSPSVHQLQAAADLYPMDGYELDDVEMGETTTDDTLDTQKHTHHLMRRLTRFRASLPAPQACYEEGCSALSNKKISVWDTKRCTRMTKCTRFTACLFAAGTFIVLFVLLIVNFDDTSVLIRGSSKSVVVVNKALDHYYKTGIIDIRIGVPFGPNEAADPPQNILGSAIPPAYYPPPPSPPTPTPAPTSSPPNSTAPAYKPAARPYKAFPWPWK